MKKMLLFTLSLCVACSLRAQVIIPLGDINPGGNSSSTNNDRAVIDYNGTLFYVANDGTHGQEIWTYDGTESTMFMDLNEGAGDSEVQHMTILNGQLLFTGTDGIHGEEWWTSDGTPEGTTMIKDILEGEGSGVFTSTFWPEAGFSLYNGSIYFTGQGTSNNYELWKTDGTSAGTVLVKDIDDFGSSFPEGYTTFQGDLYFSSNEGFWKTDGTTAGTELVLAEDEENIFGFKPDFLFATNDYMLMFQDFNLWVSDGTTAGTVKIKDLDQALLNVAENTFFNLNGQVLFPASDGINGNELWTTDGTTAGTVMVKDVWPGAEGYTPQNKVKFKDKMFYKGDNGATGIELFVSDGTADGTELFHEFADGDNSGFFLPTEIIASEDYLFMNAGRSFRKEIYVSNGTPGNMTLVDIDGSPYNEARPFNFYLFDGKLFCFAETDDKGFEPYLIDPQALNNENDNDGDGFSSDIDCDDSNAAVNPGEEEEPYNGIDDDCNPDTPDDDLDGDGFGIDLDCDDDNILVNPNAMEDLTNMVDDDCDGIIDTSVHDLGGTTVSIYPNPVSERLYIDTDNPLSLLIELFDVQGKKVLSATNESILQLGSIASGMYTLKIKDTSSEKFITDRIVIQH